MEKAYEIGNKDYRQFLGNPQETFKNIKEIIIKTKNDQQCQFISAVCGYRYVLFQVICETDPNHSQIVYTHEKHPDPIFLNINNSEPVSLFGGYKTSAFIDSEGAVTIINENIIYYPEKAIKRNFLTSNEKALSVACLDNFIFVLSTKGKVYSSRIDKIVFKVVNELLEKEIIKISGKCNHCFAVCKDGSVFVMGDIKCGKLGIGEYGISQSKFILIESLRKYKIKSASAGSSHSLFLTEEGKVLACGSNAYKQLPLIKESKDERIYLPAETKIQKGATFIIAVNALSIIFVDIPPPPNMPNMNVVEKQAKIEKSSIDAKDARIKELESENEELKKRISLLESHDTTSITTSTTGYIEIMNSETIHSLQKIRRISSGASGEVFEVGKVENYALKVMHMTMDQSINFRTQRQFISEHEKLNMLKHLNIIRTYGIFMSDETTPPSILIELCVSDLNSAIKKNNLKNDQIIIYAYQIAEGMKFVHLKGFVHRDLKPSNILIAKDGTIKISDFGISKLMTAEEQSTTLGAGTQKFMAPEILNEEDYNEKADVYSFGIVLFFMLSGGQMPKITIIQMGNGKKPQIPSSFTVFAKNLINSCLEKEPKSRPSFEEILQQMEKNDYKLLELSDSDIKSIRQFVKQHKQRLPH